LKLKNNQPGHPIVGECMLEQRLMQILHANQHLLRDLDIVQSLGLPQWCIAAGYVRNHVWDHLHRIESKKWMETWPKLIVADE